MNHSLVDLLSLSSISALSTAFLRFSLGTTECIVVLTRATDFSNLPSLNSENPSDESKSLMLLECSSICRVVICAP